MRPDGKGRTWDRAQRGDFQPRVQVQRAFWWPTDVADIMDRYNGLPAVWEFPEDVYAISLEFRGGAVLVRQQGALSGSFRPAKPIAAPLELQIGETVSFLGATRRRASAASAYETVDITCEANAKGLDGEVLSADRADAPQPGSTIRLGDVPFRLAAAPARTGFDNVDLGESYFYQCRLDAAAEEEHFEAARWPAASKRFPGRFMFAAPMDEYDRLYVLAASDSSRPDSIGTFTAQFVSPGECGHPKSFTSPEVPSFRAAPADAKAPVCTVKTASGETRYLHLVEIPLDFAAMREFAYQPILQFELTKGVDVWREWPDPSYGSVHAAGPPTRVHVFGVTLRKAALPVTFEPTALAGLFTEGEKAGFDIAFANRDAKRAQRVHAELRLRSHDGTDAATLAADWALAPGATVTNRLEYAPKRFGHYDVKLVWLTGGGRGVAPTTNVYPRTFAYIRARPHGRRGIDAKGTLFGFWFWPGGEHNTLPDCQQLELAGKLGMDTYGGHGHSREGDPASKAVLEKYGMVSYMGFDLHQYNEFKSVVQPDGTRLLGDTNKWNKVKDGTLAPYVQNASSVVDPALAVFFGEPGGIGTEAVPPPFYGEPWPAMTEAQRTMYYRFAYNAATYIEAVRARSKTAKIVLPWGDPVFATRFVMDTKSKETPWLKELMGTAPDLPTFGRLPEAQVTQCCSLNRMYLFNEIWRQYRPDRKPFHVSMEAPFTMPMGPAYCLDEDRRAAHFVRAALVYCAHGVTRQFSCCEITDPADYWGEEQYGGSGLFSRVAECNPHVSCSTMATAIRHLRDAEFEGWDDLPTRTVYSLRFRNAKTKRLLRVLWCLRGRREVEIRGGGGEGLTVYDSMDNVILPGNQTIKQSNNQTILLTQMPVWVYGSDEKAAIALGAPDNSDAKAGEHVVTLGRAADLLSAKPGLFARVETDDDYLTSFVKMVKRFPAEFDVKRTDEGLSVALKSTGDQPDRGVMPYYTTLHCDVELPGVPETIALAVKAGGDWGRVVYELSDAKGEKWVSTGQRDSWNVDDQGALSYFIHDGWRLLKFPLPGAREYDAFRTKGTVWWGCYGGDGIVDYPLTLRKVYVERRPKTIYVNSLEPVPGFGPVVLGDLHLEYASEDDKTDAAVARTRRRMKVDAGELPDVYAALEKAGELPATEILSVEHPPIQDIDGRKALFSFRETPEARGYDLYVSLRPDGRGAVKVKTLAKSGERVDGLKGNTTCYAFLVYQAKDRKRWSKPSPVFKYYLEDLFSNK